jgi:glycerol-3-phosphate acyltransferase PlsY
VSKVYRRSVLVFATLAIVLGFAILVRTAYEGGGTVGYAVGALFVALGAARLYLLRQV